MTNRILLVFIFFLVLANSIANAQEYMEISYSDTFQENGNVNVEIPILSKVQRTSRYAPTINIVDESSLNENVHKIVDYVASVWESYIIDGVNLNIEIEVTGAMEEDIRTSVTYMQKDGLLYPVALVNYLEKNALEDSPYVDGKIRINANTQWDYSLGDNISHDGKNLAFGMMRAMARIMGFGSSVSIDAKGNYYFSNKRMHTIFDSLVSNASDKYLTSIDVNGGRPNQKLKEFVEEPYQTFWVTVDENRYQLASPPYTKDCLPFVYMDNGTNSLMMADAFVGNYILRVDETTQKILNRLGWNTQTQSLINIVSEDVPETGLASAYESHGFRIDGLGSSVASPQWMLQLPLADGRQEFLELKDNTLSCIVEPIANESKYRINSDGDIEGLLRFTCIVNGEKVEATPFKLYFELKPLIEYAVIERVHDNSPYASYDAYYKVKYRGAEKIKVSVEEEYSSKLKSWYVNEPYIVYGVADHITAPYYAWIDFTAENKYGKSLYTIELAPYGVPVQNEFGLCGQITNDLHTDKVDDVIEVSNVAGVKMGTVKSVSDIKHIPYKGLLIVKRICNNRVVEIGKYINK